MGFRYKIDDMDDKQIQKINIMLKGIQANEHNDWPLLPEHMGDVMSVTETSNCIQGDYTPLERIVLTANGNLQRIFSAFYNSPIKVDILKNKAKESKEDENMTIYDREVDLICNNKVLCNAKSIIRIYKPEYQTLIKDKGVGVGQLFRYLNILPKFKLINFGKHEEHLFRTYLLISDGAHCIITETFAKDLFL